MESCLAELCQQFHVGRKPALLKGAGCGPLVAGIIRPAILLPFEVMTAYSRTEIRHLLAHELAHVHRRDLLWAWLPTITRVLFFFHPAVWLAQREWRVVQEMDCDTSVLSTIKGSPLDYGQTLIKVATGKSASPGGGLLTVGVVESHQTLRRRLISMQSVSSVTRRRTAGAAAVFAMCGLVTIVPWQLAARANGRVMTMQNLREAAGLTPFSGPGITIQLSDKPIPARMKKSLVVPGLVHDYDLLQVVNQLRAAGAEGIAINRVRLGYNTAINAKGPTIYIGSQAVRHPYKIEAIGNPDALYKSLSKPHGLLALFKMAGPDARLARAAELSLSALDNLPNFYFGKSG